MLSCVLFRVLSARLVTWKSTLSKWTDRSSRILRCWSACAATAASAMLTDTTFWIDLQRERQARQRGPAHQFIAAHRAFDLQVSIITWGEFAVGFNNSSELDALLRYMWVIPLHRQIAW